MRGGDSRGGGVSSALAVCRPADTPYPTVAAATFPRKGERLLGARRTTLWTRCRAQSWTGKQEVAERGTEMLVRMTLAWKVAVPVTWLPQLAVVAVKVGDRRGPL